MGLDPLPLPMTRVNWPGMSPSAMRVVPVSPSPPGAALLFPSGLNRGLCAVEEGELGDDSSLATALMGVRIIWWSSARGARRLPPSNTSCERREKIKGKENVRM